MKKQNDIASGEQPKELESGGNRKVHALVGDEVFRFSSFPQWVNKAASWFRSCDYPSEWLICLDQKGRICKIGKHFMQARDDDSFPVTVHLIRNDF